MSGGGLRLSNRTRSVIGAVLAAALAQLGIEMAAGRVAVPADLQWLVPVCVAAITALTPHLRAAEPDRDEHGQHEQVPDD